MGSLAICTVLVDFKADVNHIDRQGRTPLLVAIRQGHYHVARYLRSQGAEIHLDDTAVSGEICALASAGQLEKLKLMVECGCSINAADYDQRTGLHLAASTGNLTSVQELLALGADINVKDRWGNTPLNDAVREGNFKVARVLRKMGACLCNKERDSWQMYEVRT